jgi:rubredoxin
MCIPCGYLYSEEITEQPWSEIPKDWICPDCGGSQKHFAEFTTEKPKNEIDELFRNYDI